MLQIQLQAGPAFHTLETWLQSAECRTISTKVYTYAGLSNRNHAIVSWKNINGEAESVSVLEQIQPVLSE